MSEIRLRYLGSNNVLKTMDYMTATYGSVSPSQYIRPRDLVKLGVVRGYSVLFNRKHGLIHVGCQTFNKSDINDLVKAVKFLRKHTVSNLKIRLYNPTKSMHYRWESDIKFTYNSYSITYKLFDSIMDKIKRLKLKLK